MAGSASGSGWVGRGRSCAALGSPERGLRGALIGGTNGKGSTQAMVAAVLAAAGQAGRADPQATPGQLSGADRGRWAAHQRRPDFGSLVAEVLEPPTGSAGATARPPSSRCSRAPRCCGSRGRASTPAWWRWVSEDGSMRPMPGMAGVAVITNVALDHMEHLGSIDRGHRAREGGHHQARRPGSHRHGRRRAGGRPSPRPAHGRAAPVAPPWR